MYSDHDVGAGEGTARCEGERDEARLECHARKHCLDPGGRWYPPMGKASGRPGLTDATHIFRSAVSHAG